jgi:hypothetical protein
LQAEMLRLRELVNQIFLIIKTYKSTIYEYHNRQKNDRNT